MKWWAWLIAAVLVIGIVGAIVQRATGDAPSQQRPAAGQTEEPTPDISDTSSDQSCLTATPGALTLLQTDIANTVPGTEFKGIGVAKSPASDMVFVAVKFHDIAGTRTGVWASLQDPTTEDHVAYVAIDEIAQISGTYKQPVEFDKKGIALPGAKAAIACLK